MDRYLHELLLKVPKSKMIFLSGPRQVGKTTLAQSLFPKHVYLNWDNLDHRKIMISRSWPRDQPFLILDEIHKMPKWKAWLKGIYDLEKNTQRFIVTGSARLNTFKKVGDSLAGRFFAFTLHPLDLREAKVFIKDQNDEKIIDQLIKLSGFPEPFLSGKEPFYKQWVRSHLDIILRQDLIDLKTVQVISKVELLIESLRASVGSTISYRSLSEDLQVSDATIKSWIQLLEDLYVIYRIVPHNKNIKRAILKSPKIYFFNHALVNITSEAAAYENLIASAILKEVDYLNDAGLGEYEVKFLRTKDGQEINFIILKDRQPMLMIEAKLSDNEPSKNFKIFAKFLPDCQEIQVVLNSNVEKEYPFGLKIISATKFLNGVREYLSK